jgi:hypothetical protein
LPAPDWDTTQDERGEYRQEEFRLLAAIALSTTFGSVSTRMQFGVATPVGEVVKNAGGGVAQGEEEEEARQEKVAVPSWVPHWPTQIVRVDIRGVG